MIPERLREIAQKLERIALDNDLFSDAMDAATASDIATRYAVRSNAERAGKPESAERIARAGIRAAIAAWLCEAARTIVSLIETEHADFQRRAFAFLKKKRADEIEAARAEGQKDMQERCAGLGAAHDERQQQLHDLLETIREQIRRGVPAEQRPEDLFKNIQDAVYAMRGRTSLAASIAALPIDGANQIQSPPAPDRESLEHILDEMMMCAENYFGAVNPKRAGHIRCALDAILGGAR